MSWKLEEKIWWYYFGKKKPNRTKGILVNCCVCDKEFPIVPSNHPKEKHYCSKQCNAKINSPFGKRGNKSFNWKGGIRKNRKGYILIYSPNHPRREAGHYVREHRLVMEQHLGRYLETWETVHHKNAIKDDNRLENLELVSYKTHNGQVQCPYCQKEFKIK